MDHDGFFVTSQPQPMHRLSWQASAVRFFETRSDFLRMDGSGPDPVGIWHVTCFPFKGYVDHAITEKEAKFIRRHVYTFKTFFAKSRYETKHEIEQLFKEFLAYPPYSLADNWDGQATQRRLWAEKVFKDRESRRKS
jgi:hypothetical protein